MTITTDPNDPRLQKYRGKGHDTEPVDQQEVYLALSEDERAKGYLKPLRDTYIHNKCGVSTRMPMATAETYARDPWFYGGTYCVGCRMHRDLEEFAWTDGEPMDPLKWSDAEQARVAEIRKQQKGEL